MDDKSSSIFRLGLTGSIATGKSTVLGMFQELGHAVFSADEAVHELYSGPAVPKIAGFCPGAIRNGVVDRDILAKYLLENPDRFLELEAQIHPMVQASYHQAVLMAQSQQKPMIVLDIPLLFEGNYDYGLDAVAVTFCDDIEQEKRALAREGMTKEKFNAILSRQMSQQEKRARADFEIDTSLCLQQTKAQIVEIVRKCLEIAVSRPNTD